MNHGEQTTGTHDEHYDLISVLYHALHGAETCEMYALNAEANGRMDFYEFFREAQVTQTGLAEQAKELLGIGDVNMGAGGVSRGAVLPKTDVEPQPPPEGGLPPEAPSEGDAPTDALLDEGVAPPGEVPSDAPRTGDVPPRTGDAPPSPSEPPVPGK